MHGLGASDMKGGVAVLVELARWIAEESPSLTVDLGLLFFPREELPVEESALPALFEAYPALRDAGLAVMLEPTDNTIQAGCLGNLNAELVFRGESAHSARPWLGRNAIDVAVEALAPVLPLPSREAVVGGLTFVEVATLTGVPGRHRVERGAGPRLVRRELPLRARPLAGGRRGAPAGAARRGRRAHRGVERPLRHGLRPTRPSSRLSARAGDLAIEPKQAWTPVAEFDGAGIPAVNLGPGATRYAHRADEQVEIAELVRTFEALRRFLVLDSV